MEFKCGICNKDFDSKESLDQHDKAKHQVKEIKKPNKKIRTYTLLILLLIAIGIFSYTIYLRSQKPGPYDNFAKCLSEKNVVIYGNDFCQYTIRQLNGFGKSQKYLKYTKCANNEELCNSKGVKITPTWEIDGKTYEGIQSLEKLSEISGCKI